MISITSSPSLKHYNYKPMVATVPSFSAVDVSDYIAKGDTALNENRLNEKKSFFKLFDLNDFWIYQINHSSQNLFVLIKIIPIKELLKMTFIQIDWFRKEK